MSKLKVAFEKYFYYTRKKYDEKKSAFYCDKVIALINVATKKDIDDIIEVKEVLQEQMWSKILYPEYGSKGELK